MPRVKFDYIVSFSSEDSENPANNLLANEVNKKKWLCSTGETSCSVVLQLAKAVQISTITIGACHTALVEVLVGRSEKPNDPFEVLVPSSVFLSPSESRRDSGVERVRSFTGEQLSEARGRRWDRLRVVCSQPYNKHCKYGLSFVHISEPEAPGAPAVPSRLLAPEGFSSDEDDFRPGEMFAKHRTSGQGLDTGSQIRQATSLALKNISDSSTKLVKTPIAKANTNRPSQSKEFNTDRQKDTLMYTDDDDRPNKRIDEIVQRHKNDKEESRKEEARGKKNDREESKKEAARKDKLQNSSRIFKDFIDDTDASDKRKDLNNSTRKDDKAPSRKPDDINQHGNRHDKRRDNSQDNERGDKRNNDTNRDKVNNDTNRDRVNNDDRRNVDRDNRKRPHSDAKPKDKELRAGPVSSSPHTLLSGVVFALSGYENPRRARLRDAAVAMGAKFERDWTPNCTHLICAFPNTPKLKTVRASRSDCIAVLGEWVEQCCDKRRLLPWQWFATEPKKKVNPPENYDEIVEEENDTDDEIEKVLQNQKKRRVDNSPTSNRDRSPRPQTSKDKSPKPHSSKDRSPKPHSSRDKSPKPHSSRDRSPKPHSSRDRSPKPHSSRDRSPKPHSSKEKTPSKNNSLTSKTSRDSDVAFVKDERIQGNITINSDSDETDEEKPSAKERLDKKSLLPDFFEGFTFVIEDGVEGAGFDKELLSRYVRAYGGVVMDQSFLDADSDVSYILATDGAAGGRRVRPDWVWKCHEDRRLCDVAEYML